MNLGIAPRKQQALRILMLSDVYFPRVNGVSTSIHSFRQQLRKLGHQVTLVAPAYDRGEAAEADLVRVPGFSVPRDPEDRLMNPRRLRQALERLDSQQFDVVHVQTPFGAHYEGLRYARRHQLPCVETYHTLFEEYFHHYVPVLPAGLTRYLARQLTRRQAGAVDRLIVPSTAMHSLLQELGIRTPLQVLPTGLQESDFQSGDVAAFASRFGIDRSRPTLVHVGRIAHEKNIDFLIEMLARVVRLLPEVQMLVAGEGPAMEHIRKLGRKLGLEQHLRFLGYLARDGELQSCYACGDVFVFASRTETQGLVLLEAMACGVPVVSTAHLGTRDILKEGQGALIAEDDLEDFAGKVLRLLGDPALRGQLGQAARTYAASWSAEACASQLVALYRDAGAASSPAEYMITAT